LSDDVSAPTLWGSLGEVALKVDEATTAKKPREADLSEFERKLSRTGN
jgi:hypothetical protein